MTGTCTVAKFADRVSDVGVLVLLVGSGFEVVCMASCAVGLECRIQPRDWLRVILMTLGAGKIAAVVERLEGQPQVHIDRGAPYDGFMADVAFLLAYEMPGVLACCVDAVVTIGAVTNDRRMVEAGREPCDSRMTVLAIVAACNMRRVFSSRIDSVVAADTITGDAHVVEVGRRPRCRRMAVIAIVATGDMPDVLAFCNNAVVTRKTGSEHLGMVHDDRRLPEGGAVAVLAHIRTLNMRWTLACCVDAVVAVGAIADDGCMVENRRYPGGRVMAVVATVR